MNISNPISSEINAVHFGFLSTKDILSISVKQIVNPSTFDVNGNPVDGGLYDPALGPFGRSIACSTCNLSNENCPGHVGHISLPTPVYHPVFFDQMYRLLRSTCVYCHHLRLSRQEINLYTCKLRLIDAGLIHESDGIELVGSTKTQRSDHGLSTATDVGDVVEDLEEEDTETIIRKRNKYVLKAIKMNRRVGLSSTQIMAVAQARRALVHAFLKDMIGGRRCSSCKGVSPTYRKDGYSKIFQRPLSPKEQQQMASLGLKIKHSLSKVANDKPANSEPQKRKEQDTIEPRPVVETADDSDIEMEEEAETVSEEHENPKSGTFLPPIEVLQRLTSLFKNEADILSLIYRNSKSRKAQDGNAAMFFLRAVIVPPTPFRAPSFAGNELNENPQNSILKKILDSSIRIRDINDAARGDIDKQAAFGKLIREFINLQDNVNLFIDSTKGGGAVSARQAAAIIGIKQILEKKEGLFRKNMMGKRVNYAARSVISPDPNIETNEIGVSAIPPSSWHSSQC